MNRKAIALGLIMLGVTGITVMASSAGWGLPQPSKEPPSIREGSTRLGKPGHHGTRYFIGGGIFHGK